MRFPALLALLSIILGHAAPLAAQALQVFFADVEGGQATLFVTPSHESLLIDTGWAGYASRDAKRIVALAKQAGVTRIDTLVVTHYHADHVGGVAQLAALMPIGRAIDHGPNTETTGSGSAPTVAAYDAYAQLLASRQIHHRVVKPGEFISVEGLAVQVVSANGAVITHPLPAAGKMNAACAESPVKPLEDSENDKSVGLIITFGHTRILDLGDLTWAAERGLVCPRNLLGPVDVYVASHHGLNRSGSPALLGAITPRLAILDNGSTKGAAADTWDTIARSPRIANGNGAIWQLHRAVNNDAAHNVPDARIANLEAPGLSTEDAGHFLQLSVALDGSLTMFNARTKASVPYAAR